MTSYYDLLGVGVDADFEEVRRAYHRKAQLLHPDRHPGSSDVERRQAEAAMAALNEAWNTLRNTEARRRYDIESGLLASDEAEPEPDPELDPEPQPEPEPNSAVPLRKGRVIVALVVVLAMFASAVALFSQPDAQTGRWSGGEIADLRWRALNAGMTAPQATCFVEAVTSGYGPADEVPLAAVQQLANACR